MGICRSVSQSNIINLDYVSVARKREDLMMDYLYSMKPIFNWFVNYPMEEFTDDNNLNSILGIMHADLLDGEYFLSSTLGFNACCKAVHARLNILKSCCP